MRMPTAEDLDRDGDAADDAYDEQCVRVDEGKECPRCHDQRSIRTRVVPSVRFECALCGAKWTHFSGGREAA